MKLMKKIFAEDTINKTSNVDGGAFNVVSYDLSMLFGVCLLTAAFTTLIQVQLLRLTVARRYRDRIRDLTNGKTK